MKNLFLIRHGESMQNTYENYKEKLPDHKVYLTDKGKEQARTAGNILNTYFYMNDLDKDNTIMFNSPYLRARETSELLNESLRIDKTKEDYLLIEHQYGLFSDNSLRFNKETYPEFFNYYDLFYQNEGNFYVKFPMGESPMDVAIRSKLFLEDLKKNYDDFENIIVVSHGTLLKTMIMNIYNYSPEWYAHNKHMGNCEIRIIDEEQKMRVLHK